MKAWDKFFHGPIPARGYLAFRRCAFGIYFAAIAFSALAYPANIEPIFRLEPRALRLLHLPPPGAAWTPLFLTLCASLLLAAAGLAGRLPVVVACFLSFYLCGERLSYGHLGHEQTILVLGLLVLAFAPAPSRAPQPRWPLQLLRIYVAYVLFSAGIFKLLLNSPLWLSGQAVSDSVAHLSTPSGLPAMAAFLARSPGLCVVLTYATLLLEVLFPLAFFSRRAKAVLVPAGFCFVWGIWAVFGYRFAFYMAPLFVAWLPWEKTGGADAPPVVEGN